MKSVTGSDVHRIFSREIEQLEDGVKNSKNPYHFFTLSTLVEKNEVSSRTVVLRSVSSDPLGLTFNADRRSPKVSQLRGSEGCSVLFYDNARRVQLRLKCSPSVSHMDDLSEAVWSATPLQSRKCYMGEHVPSTEVGQWKPNIPASYTKRDPDRGDSESGYINFCVVNLNIKSMDILELHHDGHIRFSVDASDNFTFIAP